jgi:hypothetical protein
MIVLIIYFIGIFITPIVLKKMNSKCDDEFVFTISIFWPIGIIMSIFFKFAELIEYIYKKA